MKTKFLKIASIIVQVLPIIIVTGCYFPYIISTPPTKISFAAIVVALIVAMALKDNLLRTFKSLSWIKICIVMGAISGISIFLAKPLFVASVAGICGCLFAYPLEYKYKHDMDAEKEKETLEKFKSIMRGDDK